jgi:hypothetical protein
VTTSLHVPDGMFVLHLRADTDVRQQRLIGRVEHVVSGDIEAFASLDALLTFIGRHVPEQTERTNS